MPDLGRAAEVIAGSVLLDEEWYAAQAGRAFADRADAIRHWLAHPRAGATPHPLVEPGWLYPDGRWRDRTPDPLSFLLTEGADRGPHPLLGPDAGAALAWLSAAGPDSRLPGGGGVAPTYAEVRAAAFATLADAPAPTRPADVVASVVMEVPGRFARVHQWLRHLHRVHAELALDVVVVAATPAHHRIASTTATAFPAVRVLRSADPLDLARVVVRVDPRLDPPPGPWLPELLEALATGARTVQPLLVEADQTVVAAGAPGPLLRGATPADAARISALPLPGAWPGVVATDTAAPPDAPVLLVPGVRVVVPPGQLDRVLAGGPPGEETALWRTAGFAGPGRPLRVVEGVRVLRWAIDIAAPLAPRGRRWGDDPFARSLAAALERLGQHVTVDHPETRGRASRDLDDVVLVLRGLDPVPRTGPGLHLLWVISHPDEVTEAEAAAYDVVLAAGPAWAARRGAEWGRPIAPLLQCTDPTRFRPGLAEPDTGPAVLVVANARGELRPSVAAALDSGVPLTLYGDGWDDLVLPGVVAGRHVPNERLGALYAAAGVVLTDHWPDMRAEGFVANRVFDVLACGGRLVTDEPSGMRDLLGPLAGALVTWRDPDELRDLLEADPRGRFPDAARRRRTAEQVVAEHSFDARARTLLDLVLSRPETLRTAP